MLEDVECIDIIDRHAGNKPNNGGEYEHYRRLWPLGDNKWEVQYRTSADMDYCPIYGQYQDCRNCSEYYQQQCNAEAETMNTREVQVLADKYPSCLEKDSLGRTRGTIDATGHEYKPCRYGGGCIICHPCNHEKCM